MISDICVDYVQLNVEDMVITDIEGKTVEGELGVIVAGATARITSLHGATYQSTNSMTDRTRFGQSNPSSL